MSERCAADVDGRRCSKGASRTLVSDSYVLAGVPLGEQLRLCGTHTASALIGGGLWVYTDGLGVRFYGKGRLHEAPRASRGEGG